MHDHDHRRTQENDVSTDTLRPSINCRMQRTVSDSAGTTTRDNNPHGAAFRHRRSSASYTRSSSFSSTESLSSILGGSGPSSTLVGTNPSSPYPPSPVRSLRGGSRTISLGGLGSGDSSSMRQTLLKVRQDAKRRQGQKQRRLQAWLILYICCITIYLAVALRRLQGHDMTSNQHNNNDESGTSTVSTNSLSHRVARLSDSLLRRSKRFHPPIPTSRAVPLHRFSTLYPPIFPIHSRDSSIQLSPDALKMCTRTLWHTVETTTIVLPDGETFVHTGDIDDLWLRDSAAQVHPLLIPAFVDTRSHKLGQPKRRVSLIELDPRLDRIVSGLIKRTSMYIRHDPYANAFRIDDSYKFSEEQKKLGRHDLISTWNYELDSACYYMRLLYFYWKQSPNGNLADSVLRLQSVQEAIEIMVDLWIAEQRHEDDHYPIGKLLDCVNCNKPYRYPGLPRNGKGSPTNATAGMTWTGFRPSDDECLYGYLVPANMFAVVALEYMVEMAQQVWKNTVLATKAGKLAAEINQGILDYAIVHHPEFGQIYAYEVDGLGNSNLMDDANIPSLLSIPYLGYKYDPEVYSNTRRFIFSPSNPEYRKGTNSLTGEIEGYGSPHMEQAIHDNIWPMSIAMRGLTSDSVEEKVRLVEQLVKASAGTLWMHESFDAHNPSKFTRSWFCWSDSLFAELALSLTDACPLPDYKYHVLEWRDPITVLGGQFATQ